MNEIFIRIGKSLEALSTVTGSAKYRLKIFRVEKFYTERETKIENRIPSPVGKLIFLHLKSTISPSHTFKRIFRRAYSSSSSSYHHHIILE